MQNKSDYNKNWSEYFRLDESSPSGLVRYRDRLGKIVDPYIVGTKLFKKDRTVTGWKIKFKCQSYSVHRVIWVMVYGSIDTKLVIDHLDGNPLNNAITNLELKTSANNARNQNKRSSNRTGTTGVCYAKDKNGYECYLAYWNDLEGKQRSKGFSIGRFGEVEAKILASAYRKSKIKELILDGLDYTQRHGE